MMSVNVHPGKEEDKMETIDNPVGPEFMAPPEH
jgi:hypothetical protein